MTGSEPAVEQLRDILAQFLDRSGLTRHVQHDELRRVWNDLMGDAAEHTRLDAVRKNVATFRVDSAALLHELNTSAFQAAVRRAALLTNEESRGVKFTFSADKAVLSSRAPEMGEARTTVAATMTGGEGEFEIAFNPYFVIDVLKVIESDTFTLQLKSTNKPGLIREGTHYEHVIMPVNTL